MMQTKNGIPLLIFRSESFVCCDKFWCWPSWLSLEARNKNWCTYLNFGMLAQQFMPFISFLLELENMYILHPVMYSWYGISSSIIVSGRFICPVSIRCNESFWMKLMHHGVSILATKNVLPCGIKFLFVFHKKHRIVNYETVFIQRREHIHTQMSCLYIISTSLEREIWPSMAVSFINRSLWMIANPTSYSLFSAVAEKL